MTRWRAWQKGIFDGRGLGVQPCRGPNAYGPKARQGRIIRYFGRRKTLFQLLMRVDNAAALAKPMVHDLSGR